MQSKQVLAGVHLFVQVNHWNIKNVDNVIDVVLVSLWLTLNRFHTLFRCFHCWLWIINFFLNCYLAAPRPSFGHYWGGSLTHLMLITCVLYIWPEGRREPRSGVGSLSPAERLAGFEPGTFRFWSQHLNSLGHSPVK